MSSPSYDQRDEPSPRARPAAHFFDAPHPNGSTVNIPLPGRTRRPRRHPSRSWVGPPRRRQGRRRRNAAIDSPGTLTTFQVFQVCHLAMRATRFHHEERFYCGHGPWDGGPLPRPCRRPPGVQSSRRGWGDARLAGLLDAGEVGHFGHAFPSAPRLSFHQVRCRPARSVRPGSGTPGVSSYRTPPRLSPST